MAPRDDQAPQHSEIVERVLPSGRTLVLRIGSATEDIEIRSTAGELDLRITLTDAGPVVSLRGARVELDAADVAVRCRDFDVKASGEVRFEAEELRAQTKRDVHLNGAFIRLNCTTEGEAEAQELLAQLAMGNPEGVPQTPPGATGEAADGCGGHDHHPVPAEPEPGAP